jgi:hypothetical protein
MWALALMVVAAATGEGRDAGKPAATAGSEWRRSARAYVRGLERAPERLLERIDPARGLVVARSYSCERGPSESFAHTCGAGISPAARPVLGSLALHLRRLREVDGAVVRCTSAPRAACVVQPTGECASEFTIVFSEPSDTGAVLAIVERDDWQSQWFYRRRVNRRVDGLLARQHESGCSTEANPGAAGTAPPHR